MNGVFVDGNYSFVIGGRVCDKCIFVFFKVLFWFVYEIGLVMFWVDIVIVKEDLFLFDGFGDVGNYFFVIVCV